MKKKCLLLDDFVTLMLIHLAKKEMIIDMRHPNLKYACIPFAYKEIIQNILCAENKWNKMFSTLIDVDKYFDNHFSWERELSNTLDRVIKEMGKTVQINFYSDKFIISFTNDELDELIKKYADDKINNTMDHFTNLLNAYVFTREHKEAFFDCSARSVEKMRILMKQKENKY